MVRIAKVLNELPTGTALRPPPEARTATRQPTPRDSKGAAPKALQRPQARGTRWLNTPDGLAWGARRTEEFGIAASRYFHKRDRPAGALKKD